MRKVATLLFLLTCAALSSACAKPPVAALPGLPGSVFESEPEYQGPLETIGDLADGHVTNTTALRRANNKLRVICVAANRCEGTGFHEE
jgi:hypothetical protein